MSIATPSLNRLPAAERGLTIADFLVPNALAERIGIRPRHIALIVLGSLLIALTAKLTIPVPGSAVPVTGQTFGVLLVGGALGARRGATSVGLYVLLGVVGLPFFAEGKSGLQVIFGASGGYLIGFVLAGAIVGRLAELGWDRRIIGSLGAMLVGNISIYVIGVPWLMVVLNLTLAQGIAQGVTPFILGDIVKLLLAGAAFPAAWWLVGRRPSDEDD
jgi:biotin transport system substrate-specific component